VRPLYAEANLVLVPTTVSAGTNVKVLEAMAMERAAVSTSSGCAGLGLEHNENVWIADSAADFAEGVAHLIQDPHHRARLARAARLHAEKHFGWEALGEKQRGLWRELLVAAARPGDGG
jgi:glycosyltransferase involved in cell wall biosynthesis